MTPDTKRRFGRVDLDVTAFAFGTAPVGNIFAEIDEDTSTAMFETSWQAGVRFYDTAPMYGHGLSEIRTGQALRWKKRVKCSAAPSIRRSTPPPIFAPGSRATMRSSAA